jgi:hypothetical protein
VTVAFRRDLLALVIVTAFDVAVVVALFATGTWAL